MTELFNPSSSQLTRLEDALYKKTGQVTLTRLSDIDSTAELPNPDDADIMAEVVEDQRLKLEREIRGIAEELIDGGSIEAWERATSEAVSDALLLALLLGFGGVEEIRQSPDPRTTIGMVVDLIQGQLRAIRRNGDRISQGISLGQLRDIPRRRSLSFRSGYETSRIARSMMSQFHNEGIRLLNSPHPCPDCPLYQKVDWVPLGEIVPVATFCVCQSNCKCSIRTRFNPARVIQDLQGGTLLNQMGRRRKFMQQAEQEYLGRHGWL